MKSFTIPHKTLKQRSNEDLKRAEFSDMLGIWSEEDEREFNKNIEKLNTINSQDWQW